LIYPDGSIYAGNWKNGTRHGYGILKNPTGETVEGYWRYDNYIGKGTK